MQKKNIYILEGLKQFSNKCLLLQDVCDVLYVVCVFCVEF